VSITLRPNPHPEGEGFTQKNHLPPHEAMMQKTLPCLMHWPRDKTFRTAARVREHDVKKK
jgi:hypothetical protein